MPEPTPVPTHAHRIATKMALMGALEIVLDDLVSMGHADILPNQWHTLPEPLRKAAEQEYDHATVDVYTSSQTALRVFNAMMTLSDVMPSRLHEDFDQLLVKAGLVVSCTGCGKGLAPHEQGHPCSNCSTVTGTVRTFPELNYDMTVIFDNPLEGPNG